MSWFRKVTRAFGGGRKLDVPEGLWFKCEQCSEVVYRRELESTCHVCSHCGYHFRVGIDVYLCIFSDDGFVEEFDARMHSKDPLNFSDSRRYTERLRKAQKKTGLTEAVRTGIVTLEGRELVLAILDFSFLGGSMGSVVGEKIARATEQARQRSLPLIIVSSSGGARMQEGIYSLMQLAKTSARLGQFRKAGGLFISVLTHPTTGGVSASFAMLGDVIVSEPNALIGFAGPRVIRETIGQELPEGFQRSEFLLDHGFIDMIVPRPELRETTTRLLGHLLDNPHSHSAAVRS
jgi:acetyl-CoA carboxylase carboxyl transferase subunit beta